MKRRSVSGLTGILAAVMLLSGCGTSSKATYESVAETAVAYDTGSAAYVSDDIYVAERPEAEWEEVAAEEGSLEEVKDTSRKLIKNVDLYVETETFEDLLATVENKTESMGGYIENSYTYNGSSYYGSSRRNANLTIRIPAEKLDAFLSAVSEVSNVISRNDRVEDVTLQYVDLASHKLTLQTEQERLLALMEEAENIEDIIALESRLSEVRYQLESMESQLRTYDNQIDYSTVYLDIEEVNRITPVKTQTIGERIAAGFTENLYDVSENVLDFCIWLITHIPALTVWAIVLLLIFMIFRGIRKHRRNKKLNRKLTDPEKKTDDKNKEENEKNEEKNRAGEKK